MGANSLDNLLDFGPLLDEGASFSTPAPDLLDFSFTDPLLSDLPGDGSAVYLPAFPTPHIEADTPADSQFPWPPKLCVDMALGLDKEDDILLRYGIEPETFERIKRLPAFRRDLAMAMKAIREEGLTFKTKCRIFAEEYLDNLYLQINDSSVGVGTRFDIFKKLVQLGGLEPKEEKSAADQFAGLPRIAISINL